MAFDIFHRGRSVLHMLAKGNKGSDPRVDTGGGNYVFMNKSTKTLFEVAAKNLKEIHISGVDDKQNYVFELPILPDMYGATPIDISLGIDNEPLMKWSAGIFTKRTAN